MAKLAQKLYIRRPETILRVIVFAGHLRLKYIMYSQN